MTGLGTIINASAIILGGIIGIIGGKFISERYRNILIKASSICVMFIGIGGAIEKMMTVDGVNLSSGGAMMTIVSLTEIAVVQSEKAVKNSTKSKLLTGIDGINNTIYYKLESVRNELNYVSSKSGSA